MNRFHCCSTQDNNRSDLGEAHGDLYVAIGVVYFSHGVCACSGIYSSSSLHHIHIIIIVSISTTSRYIRLIFDAIIPVRGVRGILAILSACLFFIFIVFCSFSLLLAVSFFCFLLQRMQCIIM